MSHESRSERDIKSVRALQDLLRDVVATPAKYAADKALRTRLNSQGALASMSEPARGIVRMSLNHQKRVAEHALGGYDLLDGLRRGAADALAFEERKQKRGNKRNKVGLQQKVNELERERQILREDLFLLQNAYDLRCHQARTYAERAGSTTIALCAKEQREIEIKLSLRRTPAPAAKVTNIHDFKHDLR